MSNLSKADKRNLANLIELYNNYLGMDDQAQWLTHFFNNPVGGWIRDSSGTAVRNKRASALIATFPNLPLDAIRVMEKVRVSEFTISQLNWTPAA